MQVVKPNEPLKCPTAGTSKKTRQGLRDPNRVGKASISAPSECENCNREFTAEKLVDGRILVLGV